jgi:hypothetical protein
MVCLTELESNVGWSTDQCKCVREDGEGSGRVLT